MADIVRGIARYVEETESRYLTVFQDNVENNANFDYGAKLKQASVSVYALVQKPLHVGIFSHLMIDPEPDGFLQFLVISGTLNAYVIRKDIPSALGWLPTYLAKIQQDFTQMADQEMQDEVTPSVMMRPVANMEGKTCAYLVAPVQFFNWKDNTAVKGLAVDPIRPLGNLTHSGFLDRFHDEQGKFFLPDELLRFDGTKMCAFWMLCALVFDAGVDLDSIISDIPVVENYKKSFIEARPPAALPSPVAKLPKISDDKDYTNYIVTGGYVASVLAIASVILVAGLTARS